MKTINELTNREDLAEFLGYKESALTYILYKISDSDKYSEWIIPKKNGGSRTIRSPNEKLKLLQSRLAEKLYEKYEEIVKYKDKPSELSHGYVKNHSIITNAKKHKHRRFVFNIDLKNFFPSINFGRVRGYFIASKHFNLNEKVATTIAQIVCFNNELPQGSPSSPVISNLFGHLIDLRLVAMAKKYNCKYTRYVDDITFSTNLRTFPKELANKTNDGKWLLGGELRNEIHRAGFELNLNKISVQYCNSRQVVTGLVVNKRINVKVEYYKHLRACCHVLFQGRSCFDKRKKDDEQNVIQKLTLKTIEGRLTYVYQIKIIGNRLTPKFNIKQSEGIIKLFQRFLIYKYFVANEKPTIFFEGKTDPLYVKYALQSLSGRYPKLISIDEDKIEYNIYLVSISGNLKKMFELPTGCSGLDKLEQAYYENRNLYNKDIKRMPVVLVYDNDDGAKNIKGKLKNICGHDMANIQSKSAYKFRENISVLFSIDSVDSTIEDLFVPELLNEKIEGKSFSKKNDFDKSTHYGKLDFAKKIIGPRRKEIDFSKFIPILDAIQELT